MARKFMPVLQAAYENYRSCYNLTDHNLSPKERANKAQRLMIRSIDSLDCNEAQIVLLQAHAIMLDLDKSLVHYFINDPSLIEFLKTTKVKDFNVIKKFIDEVGIRIDADRSVLQYCVQSTELGITISYVKLRDTYAIYIFNNKLSYRIGLDRLDELDEPELQLAQLGINLIMYLKAFPDSISDGVPTDMYKGDKPKYSQDTSFLIKTDMSIVEKTTTDSSGRLVTPHYRSGHFRHLDSEWYKAKRGSVIFVPATMVKGRAKTVKDPKED